MDRFIVAELSKNWSRDGSIAATPLISDQFAACVNFNWKRGYRLLQFQLHRSIDHQQGIMNETIIAVFELKEDET